MSFVFRILSLMRDIRAITRGKLPQGSRAGGLIPSDASTRLRSGVSGFILQLPGT
jgi:hypothetical protein